MNDRELLEMAAKAAGIDLSWNDAEVPGYYSDFRGLPQWEYWNPFVFDGDALRLAAKLRLMIRPGKYLGDGCSVESQREGIAGCAAFREDAAEQMRYAIVVVAAEIGKGMKS